MNMKPQDATENHVQHCGTRDKLDCIRPNGNNVRTKNTVDNGIFQLCSASVQCFTCLYKAKKNIKVIQCMLIAPHAQRLNRVASAGQWEIGSCSLSVIPDPNEKRS